MHETVAHSFVASSARATRASSSSTEPEPGLRLAQYHVGGTDLSPLPFYVSLQLASATVRRQSPTSLVLTPSASLGRHVAHLRNEKVMWQLRNLTPYAAARSFTRDLQGAEIWLVAIKGTYELHPDGSTSLAARQEPVHEVPQYMGEPGRSSLQYEAELHWRKPGTDVVVLGSAHAPGGKPVTSVDIAVAVGGTRKVLRVWGDRFWRRSSGGVRLSPAAPFTQLPLVYERAFGGAAAHQREWEPRNPVGTGFATRAEHLEGLRAPNIEYPEEPITSWQQRPRPAGLGPIAREWSPRRELAGTYDQKWESERAPLLPTDFNERFFFHAPHDQQFQPHLRGGERIELYNLSASLKLSFTLPKVWLAFSSFFGSRTQEHRAVLHTVILEPDLARLQLVWHSCLPCHHREHLLERTDVIEKFYV
jgi:hypothetical protein